MLAVHLVTVPLCAAAGWLSRLVRSFALLPLVFRTFKSCLLLLVALPGLIDTIAQLLALRPLLWLSKTWRRRYLTQSNFLCTTSLAWSLALHLLCCFSQEKPLQWKEINTRTHTHTHTHTHAFSKCLWGKLNSTQTGRTLEIMTRQRPLWKSLCVDLYDHWNKYNLKLHEKTVRTF